MISPLWLKAFYSPYYFTIALRKRQAADFPYPKEFRAEFVMPANQDTWAADPFLAEQDGKTYLFYESVVNAKGRIEAAQILPDCSLSMPVIVLEEPFHLSYPQVFQKEGQWYMIPESSAKGSVTLYRALSFPYQWEPAQVLLAQPAVDTTVFEWGDKWYLLTFIPCPGSEGVTPLAYCMEGTAPNLSLHPIPWENFHSLTCRGAGSLFPSNGRLYRPAQENDERSYGNQVLFYKVSPEADHYRETLTDCLSPNAVSAGKLWFDGLHSYALSTHYEAIDIRCRCFDFWKIPRLLAAKLRSILGRK